MGVIPRAAPPAEWGREMSRKRDEYRSLKAEHRVDISKVRKAEASARLNCTWGMQTEAALVRLHVRAGPAKVLT